MATQKPGKLTGQEFLELSLRDAEAARTISESASGATRSPTFAPPLRTCSVQRADPVHWKPSPR